MIIFETVIYSLYRSKMKLHLASLKCWALKVLYHAMDMYSHTQNFDYMTDPFFIGQLFIFNDLNTDYL